MSGFGMADFIKSQQKSVASEQIKLTEALAKHLDSLSDNDREDGFHVSELYRFCPVRWVLQQVLRKPKHVPFRLRFRFDIGHVLHSMLQGYFADMGLLKGFWRCYRGHETTVISTKPAACPTEGCDSKKLRYREIGVGFEMEPGFRIVGRTDGVLNWEGEDCGWEVKSVEPEVIGVLSKPYEYPIFQLNLYMKLLRNGYFPQIKRGIITYIAASAKDTILLPMKSFVIDFSERPFEEATAKIKEAIALYKALKKGEVTVQELIARRICSTKGDGRKLDCTMVEECFSTGFLTKVVETKPQL